MKDRPTSTISAASLRARLMELSPAEANELLANQNAEELDCFRTDFDLFAHRHQEAPALAQGGAPWTTWLLLGGRGAGKTHAGASWVRDHAQQNAEARIALIGETERDVREVM